MTTKQCKSCRRPKDLSLFPNRKTTRDKKKSICKQCHSDHVCFATMLKKAEANPDNYLMCDDCDRIFSKYLKRNKYAGILAEECKFCGSKNLIKY